MPALCSSRSSLDSRQIEAALSFYKALKVYPSPRELISVYDKTLPKVPVTKSPLGVLIC